MTQTPEPLNTTRLLAPKAPTRVELLRAWRQAVCTRYPEHAPHMHWTPFIEDSQSIVSAEVYGMDRSFGVFDVNTGEGIVLES